MITEQTVVVASPDLSTAYLDGEAVILDVNSGQYYGLNEVGARIFELVEQPCSVDAIVTRLTKEYSVEGEDLKADLLAFLREMVKKDLIQLA
jgi:hypothetical protein